MAGAKRIPVVSALAAYLLATTAVHSLHDHSTHGHGCGQHCCTDSEWFEALGPVITEAATGEPTADEAGAEIPGARCDKHSAAAPFDRAAHGGHPSHSGNCEDSCFACRFLAVKSIATVVVAFVERTELVRFPAFERPISVPAAQPDLPLSRGPPCA